jgi:hypothetical protein
VLALTANVFADRIGGVFDDVLTKPLQLSTLAAAIERMAVDGEVLSDLRERRTRDGRSLLDVTLEKVGRDADKLLRSMERRRAFPRLAEDAHALKGLLLVVGARAAARRAQRVVELARSRDRSALTLSLTLRPIVESALALLRRTIDLG